MSVSGAFEAIYNSKVGVQNVVCDNPAPLSKKLEDDAVMGTWYQILHVEEEPFTQDKWTCGQVIYSQMDNHGSFMEHTVGQDAAFGPHYGSHGEFYCPEFLESGRCFVRYRDDHWLKSQVIDTDFENYMITYRCLPQHGSYVTLLSRTPELDEEFMENIMFKLGNKLPNMNFQTLIKDVQGYFHCNYITDEHNRDFFIQ